MSKHIAIAAVVLALLAPSASASPSAWRLEGVPQRQYGHPGWLGWATNDAAYPSGFAIRIKGLGHATAVCTNPDGTLSAARKPLRSGRLYVFGIVPRAVSCDISVDVLRQGWAELRFYTRG